MSSETVGLDQFDDDPDVVDGEIRAVLGVVLDHLVSSYVAQVLGDMESGQRHAELAQEFMLTELSPWHMTRAIYTMLWPAVEDSAQRILTDIPWEEP